MKIQWLGHSAFKISSGDVTIIHDPYKDILGYKLPKELKANIVCTSHGHSDHSYIQAVNGQFKHINESGLTNIGDISINGLNSFHDELEGAKRGTNIIFKYTLDDITIAHLGDLGHSLTDELIEQLSDVDVMLIPCGGGFTIGSQIAAEIIELTKPQIVVPMHFRTKALSIFGFKFEKLDNLLSKIDYQPITTKEYELPSGSIDENIVLILDYK